MGYKSETTRLFEGRGFRINAFPDEAAKEEARERLGQRIIQLGAEWKLVTRNEHNALMIDEYENVKVIHLRWGVLDGGPRLVEETTEDGYVKTVRINMIPALVPGVVNAADAITNPANKQDVWIYVKFGAGLLRTALQYDVLREKKVPINENNLQM